MKRETKERKKNSRERRRERKKGERESIFFLFFSSLFFSFLFLFFLSSFFFPWLLLGKTGDRVVPSLFGRSEAAVDAVVVSGRRAMSPQSGETKPTVGGDH